MTKQSGPTAPEDPAVDVELAGVTKQFGGVMAVRDLSLKVRKGEILGLLGPSGCGKTTLLRVIAGLEQPDSGSVIIQGAIVNDLPVYKRNLGMVFQSYALFPHMTVFENIAFGLKMRNLSKAEIQRAVGEAMDLVRLPGLEARMPSQLSGGQRQRVALARAVVTRPAVLLLDEPLAALDKKLREEMQIEIKLLQRQVGITTVFVTHDQEEALALSDRIVVMSAGEILQIGTPEEVYERPENRFVSDFIGTSNRLCGDVVGREGGLVIVETDEGVRCFVVIDASEPGSRVEIIVRPERLRINTDTLGLANQFQGMVESIIYRGVATDYYIRIKPHKLLLVSIPTTETSEASGRRRYSIGQTVCVGWDPESALLFGDRSKVTHH